MPNQENFQQSGYSQLTMDMKNAIARYEIDDTDWFSGAVFRFDIECLDYWKDCENGAIDFQNTVEDVDFDIDFIGDATDLFFDSIDTQKLYVLTTTQVYILDRDLTLNAPPIKLGIDPTL